ncbi:MAG: membrane or secreted protein [Bacteroidota bacterium]
MKKIALLILLILPFTLNAQNLVGAWERTFTSPEGDTLKNVVIFADGYQVATTFHASTGEFRNTNGGSWSLNGNMMTETIEFDSKNPGRTGSEVSFEIKVSEKQLELVDHKAIWTKIDNGKPGKLQGAWLMSGRVRNGETQSRDTNRPRKTMKILSGTRFQWIAYNTETKEFKGCGGGTYTTVNGKYTENIEFFSRDDSKAGLSLMFDFELADDKWQHKGLSSKGDPIHEIWSVRD